MCDTIEIWSGVFTMKIKRKVALLGMFVLFCSFLMVIPIQAKPTRTVIDFVYFLEASGDPERFWFSDEGMYQVRGTPHEGYNTQVIQICQVVFTILEI